MLDSIVGTFKITALSLDMLFGSGVEHPVSDDSECHRNIPQATVALLAAKVVVYPVAGVREVTSGSWWLNAR